MENRIKTPQCRTEYEKNIFQVVEIGEKKMQSEDESLRANFQMATFPHLSRVRKLPNGRINLLTINEMLRLQANMMNTLTLENLNDEDI